MSISMSELEIIGHSMPSMGGRVDVAIATKLDGRVEAALAARRTAGRIEAWAARLTRFSPASDLSVLNEHEGALASVRPTLAAVLGWARVAQERSEGVVDATMLDARLAAESGDDPEPSLGRGWSLAPAGRLTVVERQSDFDFDLDGLAKGWIADRAADLLHGWPGVAVDADGDIAIHADPGVEWLVEIADPRADDDQDPPLATLRLTGGDGWSRSYGVATSGTSVHRWQLEGGRRAHHLIDRRTRRPADTDVVQATVVAPSAREAEMFAKSAVILGSHRAHEFLARSSAHAAVLLLECDDLVALPGTERWLA